MPSRNNLILSSPKNPHAGVKNFFRYLIYIILLFLSFILAGTGDYIKPLYLIPLAIGIASVSPLGIAGSAGIICGFFMDMSSNSPLGYHALLLFLICMGISILYDRLLTGHFFNYFLLNAAAAFVIITCDFCFRYALWGYAHLSYYYTHYCLRCLLYTIIVSVFFYLIFLLVHHFLLPPRKRRLEKNVKPLAEEDRLEDIPNTLKR